MNEEPNYFGDILIIDDNPGDVRLIEETLKETELDATVHALSDGPHAVSVLQDGDETGEIPVPDAILLDLHLAEMDGDEVLREVEDRVRDVPVVAISGSEAGAALKLDDIEDKVDACLVKPLSPEDLEGALLSKEDGRPNPVNTENGDDGNGDANEGRVAR